MNTEERSPNKPGDPENSDSKFDFEIPELLQFSQWLDQSLSEIEARYADFVTTKSNRNFFSRQ